MGYKNYHGQDGFKPEFHDGDTNKEYPNPDQVHHFGAFLSAGISNTKNMPLGHTAVDWATGNKGDVALSIMGWTMGQHLRNNPSDLINIGQLIRANICVKG